MKQAKRDTMLLETPFHSRVAELCEINDWGNWMGYTTPNAFFDVELEYFAIRSTTGVFDLSPMNKYRIQGPDAEAYLNRLATRDVSKIGVNRVVTPFGVMMQERSWMTARSFGWEHRISASAPINAQSTGCFGALWGSMSPLPMRLTQLLP